MSLCEDIQLRLSLTIDGEGDPDEPLVLLDHLSVCAECRAFHRQARALQRMLRVAPTATPARPHARRPLLPRARVWAAAAAVLLMLGAGWFVRSQRMPGERPPRVVDLGEADASMDDARFVELTVELLRADPRYHQTMLEILDEVRGLAYVEENASRGHALPDAPPRGILAASDSDGSRPVGLEMSAPY